MQSRFPWDKETQEYYWFFDSLMVLCQEIGHDWTEFLDLQMLGDSKKSPNSNKERNHMKTFENMTEHETSFDIVQFAIGFLPEEKKAKLLYQAVFEIAWTTLKAKIEQGFEKQEIVYALFCQINTFVS